MKTELVPTPIDRLPAYIERRDDGELITESRYVAEAFGKLHKNVMQGINAKLRDTDPDLAEWARLNFQPGVYLDGNGQERPCFKMTRDGLAELAMGFSGREAMRLRIAFLRAFKRMADELQTMQHGLREQVHALDRSEAASVAKARIGSHLMLDRKREKPLYIERFDALLKLAQPDMFRGEGLQ